MKIAYVNFVNHCYVDTEVEMKEIYTSHHIWKLFENFLVDMARVSTSQCLSLPPCLAITLTVCMQPLMDMVCLLAFHNPRAS